MAVYHMTSAGTLLCAALFFIIAAGLTWVWNRPARRCRFCGVSRNKSLMEKHVGLWFCGEGWHHWLDWQEIVGKLHEQADRPLLEQRLSPVPAKAAPESIPMDERMRPVAVKQRRSA